MAAPEQVELLREWQQISGAALDRYGDAWAAGQIDLADYQRLVKQEIKDLYIAAAWTASGDPAATTQADYGRIGRQLRDQYGYLAGFFEEIEAGQLSLEAIKTRAKLYVASSGQALEAVAAGRQGLPTLPYLPADGSTVCRTNCKCNLRWEQVEGGWDVYWVLNPAEHCPDCKARAAGSPLRIRAGAIVNPGAWD